MKKICEHCKKYAEQEFLGVFGGVDVFECEACGNQEFIDRLRKEEE